MRPHPIDLNAWQPDFFSFQEQISLQGMGQIQRTIEGDRVYLGPLKTQPLYRVDITFETQRFNPALQVSQGDEIDLTLTQSWQDAKGDLRSEDNRTWPRRHWHQGSFRIVTATGEYIPEMQNPLERWFETTVDFSSVRYQPRLQGLVEDVQLTFQPDSMMTRGKIVICERPLKPIPEPTT